MKGPSFEQFVGESFDEIRGNARGNATVIMRLVHSLKTIGAATEHASRTALISKHISLLEDLANRTIDSDYDATRVKRLLD